MSASPPRRGVLRASLLALLSLALAVVLWPGRSAPQGPAAVGALAGQTVTRLPDGRWLRVGGEGDRGPVGTVAVQAADAGAITPLGVTLQVPRAGHTATVLADGTVLVVGGRDANGQVVATVERLDPAAGTVAVVPTPGLIPRAFHGATLLPDGRLLLTGGRASHGIPLDTAERWDPETGTSEPLGTPLTTARTGHTSALLPDGTVLLWGGQDATGTGLAPGEILDPTTAQVTPVTTAPPAPADTDPPAVTGALPADGATGVLPDRRLALWLSKALRPDSVTPATVTLRGPDGPEPLQVVAAEGGRLLLVRPERVLRLGADYTLTLDGPQDDHGLALPTTDLRFTTAPGPPAPVMGRGTPAVPSAAPGPTPLGAGPMGATPDARTLAAATEAGSGADTRVATQGGPPLPPLRAAPGVTALSGRVLTLDGQPLADVALQVERRRTRTDRTGRFLLTHLSAGHHELLIDARPASRPTGPTYGVFEVGVDLVAGETTVLPYTNWMPALDTRHAIAIPSPTPGPLVLTTPAIPGLEVHLPAGAVVRDHEGRIARELTITEIPLDRPPFPLAPEVEVPVFFTVQPGGGYITSPSGVGARIVYPNRFGYPVATGHSFWHYDPEGPGWYVYGRGAVKPPGSQIVPDYGVGIYEFTAAMVGAGPALPPQGPPPCENRAECTAGDPVALATGQFVLTKTDLALPGLLPITLQRSTLPGDTNTRPFGRGATHNYAIFIRSVSSAIQEANLILPDGGRVHYVRTSPGTGIPGAVLEHTESPTSWYKSRLAWNATTNRWDLTLTDGTTYFFEPNWGFLQEIRDRFGNWVRITVVGGSGNLSRIESSSGRWMAFTYDGSNRITQVQDHLGRTVSYTYDGTGRLSTVTDPLSGVTTYTYDAQSRLATIRDARNIVFLTNAYDANGRVSQQTQADSTTYQFAYTLDGQGKVTQTDVTDPRGTVGRVALNAAGYVTADTRALGQPEQQTTTLERQAATNLVAATVDPLSRRTEYTYDANGNVLTVTRLAGTGNPVTTTYTYEPTFNQLASVTDPLNHTTSFAYNAQGALTSITDPLNHTRTLTPNAQGQPTAITTALNHTTTLGYENGDLTTITDPLGHTTKRFVDPVGRVTDVTDPLGRTARYTYDALNRLTKVTDPKGGETLFTYDPNANLLTVTDARNHTTTYTYTSMDRLATRTDPLTRAESYQYDNNGNLTQLTDRKSQVATFTYDRLNRRTQASYAGPATVTSTYDAGHRLTQVTDSVVGTITRTYDGLDRLTQETTSQGTVSYTYDAASRRGTLTAPNQAQTTYTFDHADRLTQIVQGSQTASLAYDNANRRTSLTLPNGVVIEYGYDSASRLTGLTYKLGQTTLGSLTYTYDTAGSRTAIGGTWARTGLPQAVGATSYNANNQQTAFGASTMTYDLNGNLATHTDGVGTTTYTWDSRNRLTALSGPGLTASFGYDALGRRYTKTINATRTDVLYDGLNAVQEGILPGTPVATLLTGLGLDEVLTRTDAAGLRALLPDALGSTVALSDNTGALPTTYTYEPFGTTTVSGTSSSNPVQYTGRENDGTGLYYYRARYYHPELSRFLSEDPLGFGGGDVNFYAYALGNPVVFTDGLGLTSIDQDLDPPPGPFGGRKDLFGGLGPEAPQFPGTPGLPPLAFAGGSKPPGEVIPFPPGPRPRPYWMRPPIPGRPADVIPFPQPAQPAPPSPIRPYPFIIPNVPVFQDMLDSLNGRRPGT